MNLVFSGPSGSGKGTITELLLKSESFKKFVTCTTRKPRENERNGFDYIFLDEPDFLSKVQLDEIFNVKFYGGNYYGSLEKDMDNINSNKNIIFQLTPDRALEMKRKNEDTCLILILPPSAESLSERRENRNNKRIENDIQNLEVAKQFDYVITNDDLEIACMEILSIICDFKLQKESSLSAATQENQLKIQSIIDGLTKELNKHQSQQTVFDGEVAKKWDEKSIFVNYYGIKNPIVQEIFSSAKNGMRIADIGCGTGKIDLKEGCIIADRHIHITSKQMELYGFKKNQKIYISIKGKKGSILTNIHFKVSDESYYELHLDTDDANANLIKDGDIVDII